MALINFTPSFGTTYNGQVGVPFTTDILIDMTALDPPYTYENGKISEPPSLLPIDMGLIVTPPLPIVGASSQIITLSGTPTKAGTFLLELDANAFQFGIDPVASTAQYNIIIAPSKKKRRGGIGVPPTICCDPKSFADKVCPPVVQHKGYYYDKISDNCYILRRR